MQIDVESSYRIFWKWFRIFYKCFEHADDARPLCSELIPR